MMIKEFFKSKKNLYPLILLRKCFSSNYLADIFGIRRKPEILQMPITSRCNSRCVTCNVWKHKDKIDINPVKLADILAQPYFSKVKGVGINGGELSVVHDFDKILNAVFVLKNLKAFYFITNGLLPDKILQMLEYSKQECDKRGVVLNVTISVDGFGEVHEKIRGVPHCFERTKKLLDALKDNPNKYAHSVSIGCTLSKDNIAFIQQTEVFLCQYPFKVQYHLAVPNKRIHTFDDAANYYVLGDEHARMLALEYFYSKFCVAKGAEKYAYFCQYYFLKNNGKGRLSQCQYKYRDVTIDENLNMYLCATASDSLGDLKDTDFKNIITKSNFRKMEKSTFKCCDECIHYIYDMPTLKGWYLFVKETIKHRLDWGRKFRILAK